MCSSFVCITKDVDAVIIDEVENADIEMTDTEYDGDIEEMGIGIKSNQRTKRSIKNISISSKLTSKSSRSSLSSWSVNSSRLVEDPIWVEIHGETKEIKRKC